MRYFAFLILVMLFVPWASAQRGMSAAATHAGAPIRSANFAGRGNAASSFRSHRSSPYLPYSSLPFPFFADSFDPDDIYSTGYPVASQPPAFPMQAMNSLRNKTGLEQSDGNREPAQPLMIELQGSRYVRVSNPAVDGEARPLDLAADSGPARSASAPKEPTALPARDMTPVLLIYRDGSREEVHDYAIANGSLYARGDFYTDGYWNKRVEISALDLNRTLQANSERSVKFILPSSPNEVVTRP